MPARSSGSGGTWPGHLGNRSQPGQARRVGDLEVARIKDADHPLAVEALGDAADRFKRRAQEIGNIRPPEFDGQDPAAGWQWPPRHEGDGSDQKACKALFGTERAKRPGEIAQPVELRLRLAEDEAPELAAVAQGLGIVRCLNAADLSLGCRLQHTLTLGILKCESLARGRQAHNLAAALGGVMHAPQIPSDKDAEVRAAAMVKNRLIGRETDADRAFGNDPERRIAKASAEPRTACMASRAGGGLGGSPRRQPWQGPLPFVQDKAG